MERREPSIGFPRAGVGLPSEYHDCARGPSSLGEAGRSRALSARETLRKVAMGESVRVLVFAPAGW